MNSKDEVKIIGQTDPAKNDKAIRQVAIDAKISLWAAFAAWGIFILLVLANIIIPDFSIMDEILIALIFLASITAVFSIFIGFLSIWKIRCKKNELYGTIRSIFGILLSIAFLLGVIMPAFQVHPPGVRERLVCANNIKCLAMATILYAEDHNDIIPTSAKWCDLLAERKDVSKKYFICRSASHNGDKGPCHYAMNPNCEPNSSNDIVLLFETKGGWNQHGGPELLTLDNHKPRGANVAFHDGHWEFIKPKDVGKLKWKADAKE